MITMTQNILGRKKYEGSILKLKLKDHV